MAQTLATISFSPRNQAQRYRKRPPFSSQECKSYPEDGARPKLHSLQLCSYPSVLNSIYLQAYTLTKTWFCNVGTGKKDADHKNNLKHLHILKEYSRIRFGNNPREAKTNDTVGLLLASLFFFFFPRHWDRACPCMHEQDTGHISRLGQEGSLGLVVLASFKNHRGKVSHRDQRGDILLPGQLYAHRWQDHHGKNFLSHGA